MVLPVCVNTWPPVAVPAAIAAPAATTTSPAPVLAIFGVITLPMPMVLTNTPPLPLWLMVRALPSMAPASVALVPAVISTRPVPLWLMVFNKGWPDGSTPQFPPTPLTELLKISPLVATKRVTPLVLVMLLPRRPMACFALSAVPVITRSPAVLVNVTLASKPTPWPLADVPVMVMPVPAVIEPVKL